MVYSRDSSGVSALAAFLRGLLLRVPFLYPLVDSAVAGPCRDLVDLNAPGPRRLSYRSRANSDASPPRGPCLCGA